MSFGVLKRNVEKECGVSWQMMNIAFNTSYNKITAEYFSWSCESENYKTWFFLPPAWQYLKGW